MDTPFYEVNEALVAMGAEKLNLCMQCGMCAGSCPWRIVDGPFNIRRLIRMAQLGVEGYESDDILYGCTTCNKCVLKCGEIHAVHDSRDRGNPGSAQDRYWECA